MASGNTAHFQGALDVTLDMPLAGVGSRALAQSVDLTLLFLVMAAFAAGATLLLPTLPFDARGTALAVVAVLSFVLYWGFFALFELAWEGQTPGKRLLGLRVVTLEGAPPGVVPSLVRNLVRFVDFLPLGYGVGVVAMALGGDRRLGDLAAGTVVVREPRPTPALPALPEGLSSGDVALLSAWRVRAPLLTAARRRMIAAALVERLAEALPADPGDPEAALAALLQSPEAEGGLR